MPITACYIITKFSWKSGISYHYSTEYTKVSFKHGVYRVLEAILNFMYIPIVDCHSVSILLPDPSTCIIY